MLPFPVQRWLWLERHGQEGWSETRGLLRQLPTPALPAALPGQIRRRLREESRKPRPVSWAWTVKTSLKPFAIPTTVGLLAALFFFGIFIRMFEVPVHAGSPDVPLSVRTPPRLRTIALIETTTGISCMEVTLLIDQNGRVADYKVIKGKQTREELRQLHNLVVFSVFDPATVFGKPTSQSVTLALRDGQLTALSL